MNPSLKFLVLLDGSERSLKTIDYVASVRPLRKIRLVLYQVFGDVPEYYWDMVADTGSIHGMKELERWQHEARNESQAFMEKARSILVAGGFREEMVEIKLHTRTVGIARDILEEARRGYGGIIMRRRGRSNVKSVVVGSVANKLLSRLPDIPVILAGVRRQNKRVLMAVNGPAAADRAVDMVTTLLGGYDYRIELLHVVRNGAGDGTDAMPPDVVKSLTSDVENRLKALKERLVGAGFDEALVSEKMIFDVVSRADAIVAEAEAQDCGTIVMGRKVASGPEDIITGSVCSKVIHRGREFTVWIV